jgi:ribonuclease P protein subunit RPR2
VKTRANAKAEAINTVKSLMGHAVRTSERDLALAQRQAELARKVMLRYNVRLDYSTKRFICHGCKKLIVPGVNARVRVGSGSPPVIRITCLECGHTNRKLAKQQKGLK